MPRRNGETTGVCQQLAMLVVLAFYSTAFGAVTILDPSQVAREFAQRLWQKKDGLPDNTVQTLLQARDGYLWIGTRRGLARFDGLKFTVFDHLNTPEMPDDNCKSLAEDLEGNLWITTDDGVLRWRDGAFKRFTRRDGLAPQESTSRDSTGLLYADRHGGVWVRSILLNLLQNGMIRHFGPDQGFEDFNLYALHEDSSGELWAGAGRLYRFNRQAGRFEIQPEPPGHGMVIFGIQDSAAGGLWVLSNNLNGRDFKHWLYRYEAGRWEMILDQFAPDFRGSFLKTDRRGDLWWSAGAGLDRFRNGHVTRYLLPNEANAGYVLCFLEDRNGNYWFGTDLDGLHCWKPNAISSYSTRDGLPNDSTWTMCEARDGSVWIGTEQGISQYKDGRFRNFTQHGGLSKHNVRSVAEDSSGAIWVGTGGGLNVIRNGVIEQKPFPHQPDLNKIRVVYPAKNGALWVGAVGGLFRLKDDEWTTFTPTNGLAKAGLHGDVLALREDKAGNLWVGTAGGGLQSFRDGKFTTFTTTNGLSNNFVWAFHEDADGVLWIGTESGLNRCENGRFTVLTTREGLPADLVNEILEDEFGNLWVSHDHGIYRVRKQELNQVAAGQAKAVRTVSYDESDGLPINETNGQKSQPAGCKTRDGRLWFPTTKGVTVIDPKLCDLDEVAPHAVIEQIRADGELIFDNRAAPATNPLLESRSSGRESAPSEIPDGQGLLTSTASVQQGTTRLRLPPGSGRVLEFRYTAPVFTAPEKAAFRYRLRGAGDGWIEAGTRREAYFTKLSPGDYDFEVVAANHRGVWSEQRASFAFSITPFYYQTWWFYLTCGLATAGVIAGIVVWRIRELRKLHWLEQQTAITEERTRIAKDLHDGLGADLTRLTLLADLASGEVGSVGGEHARKLSQTSRDAVRELKELIWLAHPANDTVEGLVSRICQTAEDLLGDARIRCRLDLAPQFPKCSLSLEQRRNLLLVVREALNNIMRHAAATEVWLRGGGDDRTVRLAIEDNGRGFDPASTRREGLGLTSMRRRVENSGGNFEIVSRPGGGTRILMTVRLGTAGK